MEPTSAGQRDRRIWHRAAAALSPDADLADALADLAARNRRATYELWRQVHRRRVYFLAGKEPVRVNLTDDATLTRAWRLDMTTGRIVPSDHTDDVATGDYQRVTELTWLLATENKRRKLKVRGAIAKAYRKAFWKRDKAYHRMILTDTFDLWAEKFAAEDGR
jgi:hypothetical protein